MVVHDLAASNATQTVSYAPARYGDETKAMCDGGLSKACLTPWAHRPRSDLERVQAVTIDDFLRHRGVAETEAVSLHEPNETSAHAMLAKVTRAKLDWRHRIEV